MDVYDLLSCSEAEQITACQAEHSTSVQLIRDLLRSPKTRDVDRLRLVLIYALRYEKQSSNCVSEFIDILSKTLPEADFSVSYRVRSVLFTTTRLDGCDSYRTAT